MKRKLLAMAIAAGLLGGCSITVMEGTSETGIKAEMRLINQKGETSMLVGKDVIEATHKAKEG